jgi:hypothetical protein
MLGESKIILPSSPPGMEKSAARISHFCILAVEDLLPSLALSIPDCMAYKCKPTDNK